MTAESSEVAMTHPLPWTVTRVDARSSLSVVVDAEGFEVTGGMLQRDAEYIVLACNAHADLIAVREAAKVAADMLAFHNPQSQACKNLRAAISKAEVQS